MGRDGARPSRGEQMVRNGHWNFDWDLEGTGPSAPGIRWDNVLISRLQGTAALQDNNSLQVQSAIGAARQESGMPNPST